MERLVDIICRILEFILILHSNNIKLYYMRKKSLLFAGLALCASMPLLAQEEDAPSWYVGVTGGYHVTFPSFSKIDREVFPDFTNKDAGVFSIFVQGEFGSQRQWAVRPELAFTKRGGGISNIGINQIDYEREDIDNIFYKVKSGYMDIRVPLIYNLGNTSWAVRPYVYVAPILGFSTGGQILLQEDYADHSYAGYHLDLNTSNYNSIYFAGAAALGARYHFPLGSSKAFVGIELMYEYGFTDTYGSKEKDGDAININPMFPENAKVDGARKYQGFEAKLTFGIPFDAFKRKKKVETAVVEEEEVYVPVVEVVEKVEEKPCYTLDEIVDIMARGESVYGKTICAIDDDINFEFAKADINSSSYHYLDRLAETLKRTNSNVIVKGHTDNVGSDEVNMKLSKNRAENVKKYLVQRGVPSSRLTVEYFGSTRPIYSNDTPEGRAKNRRVEFEIKN